MSYDELKSELQDAYDYLSDVTFELNGKHGGIFPASDTDVLVVFGDERKRVSSFSGLLSLKFDNQPLLLQLLKKARKSKKYCTKREKNSIILLKVEVENLSPTRHF